MNAFRVRDKASSIESFFFFFLFSMTCARTFLSINQSALTKKKKNRREKKKMELVNTRSIDRSSIKQLG